MYKAGRHSESKIRVPNQELKNTGHWEGVMNRIRPKILVVDDDAAVRKFFLQVLTPIAYDVAESGDAQRALEAIESGDFDIVVCDVWMPGATGLDLLAMAQQTRWTSDSFSSPANFKSIPSSPRCDYKLLIFCSSH